jgi:phenylacetate-coenzyme A ligase PaaK-like adenylate-forming protein
MARYTQTEWNDKIFNTWPGDFDALALETFKFQFENNSVYNNYVRLLGVSPAMVRSIEQVPFLPIRFFKTHKVVSFDLEPQFVFESSGTTGTQNSNHYIKDISLYEESFCRGFEKMYGPVKDYCIIGLLPSYLERKNASLVYMVDKLIGLSEHSASGFYLDEYEKLSRALVELEKQQQKTLLIGVSFALLDFAEQFPISLKHTIIMETGGMKGRKKEMIREELHKTLSVAFEVDAIHSEYGMTELLSQAYSKGEGLFNCPPWMQVFARDEDDPLHIKQGPGVQTGVLNVIDLANIYSCSFIATDDAGKIYADGSFEVLGRTDNSDLRGCSLMVL